MKEILRLAQVNCLPLARRYDSSDKLAHPLSTKGIEELCLAIATGGPRCLWEVTLGSLCQVGPMSADWVLDKRRIEKREITHMVSEELHLCWMQRVADVPDKQ